MSPRNWDYEFNKGTEQATSAKNATNEEQITSLPGNGGKELNF